MYDSASGLRSKFLVDILMSNAGPPHPFIVCGVGGPYQAEVGREVRSLLLNELECLLRIASLEFAGGLPMITSRIE